METLGPPPLSQTCRASAPNVFPFSKGHSVHNPNSRFLALLRKFFHFFFFGQRSPEPTHFSLSTPVTLASATVSTLQQNQLQTFQGPGKNERTEPRVQKRFRIPVGRQHSVTPSSGLWAHTHRAPPALQPETRGTQRRMDQVGLPDPRQQG